jgi:hypothetical protein
MAEHFLYLTTTGRTSGEPRQIEIWFIERGGLHYVVSEMRERSGWVKNLTKRAEVTFSVGTREDRGAVLPPTPARARVVRAGDEPELAQAVSALMDGKYGWSDGLIVELAPG